MAFDFVEFVTGSIKNRNHIATLDRVNSFNEPCEAYKSVFRFDESFKNHVERSGSTAHFEGLHQADALVFDFDYAEDLSKAQESAVTFMRSLEVNYGIPLEYWRIAFSGAKGFHLSLPMAACGEFQPDTNFSDQYRAVCKEISYGFKYLDYSIYQINHVFRIMGSLNVKSGLYKIPLTLAELTLLTLEEIQERAKHPRTIENYPEEEIMPVPDLVRLWKKNAIVVSATDQREDPTPMDSFLMPADNGNRNNMAISYCGSLISYHVPESKALSVLRLWNKNNPEPLPDHELSLLVERAYRNYGRDFKAKSRELYTLSDAEKEYEKLADTPEEEKVKFGLISLDTKIRGFMPGMLASVVAKSSNGKSAFVLNVIAQHARRSKMPVIFFSLEMPLALVHERLLQSELKLSRSEIADAYKYNREGIKEKSALIQHELENFFVITEAGLTLENIAEIIRMVEERTGLHPSLIVIDYVSLLDGKGRDLYEKTTSLAIGLKQLAKNLSVPVIFLAQTQKTNTVYSELDENSGKDAGSILDASDFQIAIWRKFVDEKIASSSEWIEFNMKLTKNRNGAQGQTFQARMNRLSMLWEEVPMKEYHQKEIHGNEIKIQQGNSRIEES